MFYIITGLIGLASIAAPFVLGFTANTAALWTSLVVGGVLVVSAVAEFLEQDRDNLEYWIAGLFGIGAIAAPFVLGFNDIAKALWTSFAVGVLAVVVAGTRLLTRTSE